MIHSFPVTWNVVLKTCSKGCAALCSKIKCRASCVLFPKFRISLPNSIILIYEFIDRLKKNTFHFFHFLKEQQQQQQKYSTILCIFGLLPKNVDNFT